MAALSKRAPWPAVIEIQLEPAGAILFRHAHVADLVHRGRFPRAHLDSSMARLGVGHSRQTDQLASQKARSLSSRLGQSSRECSLAQIQPRMLPFSRLAIQ